MDIEKIGKTQLELSSKFWRKREQSPLAYTNEDTVLYMALVYEFGRNNCNNPVKLSDRHLDNLTSLGTIPISQSRNNLKNNNLISFKESDGGIEYTICLGH
ncbi:hypothetical protein V9L05_18120 [Bernardetia sp. Wsw4-3y2]|uniref:hypothetical protein n=1 Tax=Bernardetia sp. Wsw4-3y2 TaxID=3127471 RepID=UPI0030D43193